MNVEGVERVVEAQTVLFQQHAKSGRERRGMCSVRRRPTQTHEEGGWRSVGFPELAESPSRPSRESLKTPSCAETRVALNKTDSHNIERCCNLVVKGDKLSFAEVGVRALRLWMAFWYFFLDVWSDGLVCESIFFSTMLIFFSSLSVAEAHNVWQHYTVTN